MNSRTLTLRLLGLFVVCSFLITGAASAQCNTNCMAGLKPGFGGTTPFYTVYLDPSLNSTERQAMISGMNMWNTWFNQNGRGTPFLVVGAPPANLTVQIDPTMHWGDAGAVNSGNVIDVNPAYNGQNSDFWTQVMTHETGHSLGYTDVNTGGCAGQTIMFGNIAVGQNSYLTHLTGTDTCALDTDYPPPNGPPPIDSGLQTATDPTEPLILDLDGTGIQTSGTADPVWFDMIGDGTLERMSWTKGHTNAGFLWIDLNHNGKVDNGSELFGIGTTMPDGTKAHNGFEALAMYDDPRYGGNGDGVISAADEVWNHLRIWIDWNHNGVCDPGESGPIHEYGIESIPLGAVINFRVDANGNTHMLTGTYFKHVTQAGPAHDSQFLIESLEFQLVP